MYEAIGIKLSHSQYVALVHVRDNAAREGFEQGPHEWGVFLELEKLGLIAFHSDAGLRVFAAWTLRKGDDWLYDFEQAERDRKRLSRREWGMIAVNLGGGAALGFLASLGVELVAHAALGL